MSRHLLCLFILLAADGQAENPLRTFSNAAGKTLQDRIVKFDFQARQVFFEKNGRIPIEAFGPEDQDYILRWNQEDGFTSSMRFKIAVRKKNWARMKHEQNVTPYLIEAVEIPGKKMLGHHITMIDDYTEYNAIHFQASGCEIELRNQNFFPIENLVVESRVFFEQEEYVMTDSLFASSKNEYNDTLTTEKTRFHSESVPIIMPKEKTLLYSACAIAIDHQVERNSLISSAEQDEEEEGEEIEPEVEGFGEWDDHGRRRKSRVHGVWVRVGIKGLDGGMIWREIISPASLSKKYSWETEKTAAPHTGETVP